MFEGGSSIGRRRQSLEYPMMGMWEGHGQGCIMIGVHERGQAYWMPCRVRSLCGFDLLSARSPLAKSTRATKSHYAATLQEESKQMPKQV